MPFQVNCPKCNRPVQVADQQSGMTLACPYCGGQFTARGPGGSGVRSAVLRQQVASALQSRAQAPAPAASDDEDIMPGWDENEVAARLASVQIPPAQSTPLPAPARPGAAPAYHAAATMPSVPAVRLDIGAATSSGRVRNRNEDSYVVQQLRWSNRNQGHDVALAIVADGMGGYDAGDIASGLAIQTMIGTLGAAFTSAMTAGQPGNPAQALESAIRMANQAVHRKAQAEANCRGMGTTLAAALIWNGQAFCGHVGDCRVYHARAGSVQQITQDHTLVNKMVQMGQLTPQEALTHKARNEVAQAVGRQPDVSPSAHQLRLGSGDWLVLACDGLHAHVDLNALQAALRSATAAAPLAIQLVNQANQGGGSDNCTVLAIRCY